MKLFPHRPAPPPVKSWHVPVLKVSLEGLVDDTWDLTMKTILPHIDGISDVRRISHDADVALELSILALEHLLYYDAILIIDLFFFGNVYACTPEIKDFVADKDNMQDECADYVYVNGPRLPNYYLCDLYTSLCTSRTLREWLVHHFNHNFPVLNYVDVRRFIQFGVIKGFLYRINKFAISSKYINSLITGRHFTVEGVQELLKYVDGTHSFDQIIAEQNIDDATIMEKLKKFPDGDLKILYR
jgi:hypothetical protein